MPAGSSLWASPPTTPSWSSPPGSLSLCSYQAESRPGSLLSIFSHTLLPTGYSMSSQRTLPHFWTKFGIKPSEECYSGMFFSICIWINNQCFAACFNKTVSLIGGCYCSLRQYPGGQLPWWRIQTQAWDPLVHQHSTVWIFFPHEAHSGDGDSGQAFIPKIQGTASPCLVKLSTARINKILMKTLISFKGVGAFCRLNILPLFCCRFRDFLFICI